MPDTLPTGTLVHEAAADDAWWRSAVIYQVYPRSFADADGDGTGDIRGIASRLTHLRDLGVDALWISPFYPSPQADAGYDVSEYCDVDPRFGSLEDVDELIARAHSLGLRVIVDIVPNHTSDEHEWFQRALRSAPGSAEREWYVFREADPADPDRPPNNWQSEFSGPAWSKTQDGQWYLHLYDPKQPDLNWNNPEVREAFLEILRFWLDRGVDGFRVDVAHGLVKAEGLPDSAHSLEEVFHGTVPTAASPFYDQDGVHEIYRDWRLLLDRYPGDRAMVAEAWVQPYDRLARYVRTDEFHQAFNFEFLQSSWDASTLRQGIIRSLRSNDAVGAPTTWVLSNHDVVRHATRFGLDREIGPAGPPAGLPAPDADAGLRRARAATTMLLALPGSAYLYQGEELGLPEVLDLPAAVRQDPTFRRTRGEVLGRDGCRVPVPWEQDATAFGFNESGRSWLPQPEVFGGLAADRQTGDGTSTLELYRRLLALRRERLLGTGGLSMLDLGEDLVAFDITASEQRTRVVLNLGSEDWQIPEGWHVIAASTPELHDRVFTDAAVWLERVVRGEPI